MCNTAFVLKRKDRETLRNRIARDSPTSEFDVRSFRYLINVELCIYEFHILINRVNKVGENTVLHHLRWTLLYMTSTKKPKVIPTCLQNLDKNCRQFVFVVGLLTNTRGKLIIYLDNSSSWLCTLALSKW